MDSRQKDIKQLDTSALRKSVTFSIVMAMVVLVSIVAIGTSLIQKNRQADHEKRYDVQLHKSISHVINHYIEDYTNLVVRMSNTTNMTELLIQGDREGLYKLLKPKWDLIVKSEPNVKIMHLHLADGTSFLRIHKPEFFGDKLSDIRPMIDNVHTYHNQLSGYETGKLAIAYRIITPIFDKENNYIGAFEIGINPNFILDAVYKLSGFCGLIFIKDDPLNLFKKSNKIVIDGFRLQTERTLETETTCDVLNVKNLKDDVRVFTPDKKYKTHLFELNDFKDQSKVKILFFQDLSEAGRFRSYLLSVLCISAIFTLIFLTWYIYRRIGIYQKRVAKLYHKHIDKIDESENRFRLLYEQAPEAYQSLDEDGNLIMVNCKWCEELGYAQEEVVGKNFGDFLAPGYSEVFAENFPKFKAAGGISGVEFEMLKKDGNTIVVSFNGNIVYDEDGKFLQTHCIFSNISERKRMQQELESERNKLKNIFNAMEDGVYVVNEDFDIEYVNPVLTKDFGDYHGRKCYEYFHDRDEVCTMCKNSEVHEGKTIRWQWYSSKNGKTYDLIDTPLYNSDGSISKLELFRDITENRLIEEKLQFNEKYLQTLFDVTPNIMITTDGEEIDRANPAMLEFFGYETVEAFKSEHRCVCDFFEGDRECLRAKMGEITWLEYALLNKDKLHKVCMFKDGVRHHFVVWAEQLKVDENYRSLVYFADVTEMQELNQRLEYALSGANDGLWDWDMISGTVYFSLRWKSMLGYADEEVAANIEEFNRLVHPDDIARIYIGVQNHIDNESIFEEVVRMRHKDGHWAWIMTRGKVVEYDEDKNATRMVGVHTDISEQKELELQLVENEQRYFDFFEHTKSANIMYSTDDDGETFKIKALNNMVEKLESVKRDEIIGKRVDEVFEGVGKFGLLDVFREVYKSGEAQKMPITFYKDEKLTGWRENYVFKLSNGDIVASYEDRTEEKILELKLLASKLEFDMFMHFIPANILIKDSDGVIVFANDSSSQFFGKESIVGMKAEDLLPLDVAKKTDEFAKKIIEFGKHEEINEFYNYKNEKIIVRSLGFKIEIKDSVQIGMVMMDITQSYLDKKEIEDKEEIMIAQSRHAAMGEMISMIAHQWRQPISVIAMGANNILADIELDMLEEKTLKSGAKDIIHQTQELSKTIDDFRNFFRPGKISEEILPEDIFSEAFGVIGKALSNNNIEIISEYQDTKKIKTYSRELMQVIINILKNSKEALVEKREDERKIFVSINDSGDDVVIKICDNGGGIKEEILGRVFDPYFTTKSKTNGTGLGLYMSKTIVEKHLGGTLNVYNRDNKENSEAGESALGYGACFEIMLPYAIGLREEG